MEFVRVFIVILKVLKMKVNFYPLIHPILAETKDQILLFFFLANTYKQPEKISAKKKF